MTVAAQLFNLAVVSLAALRAWRLLAVDDVTAWLRDPLDERANRSRAAAWAYDGLRCPWCAGSWLAFAAVAVLDVYASVWLPYAQALAAAVIVGVIGQRVDN